MRGDIDAEARVVRPALDELWEARFAFHHTVFLTMLAEALGSAGRVAEGLAAVDKAITRSERTEERWAIAEVLRAKGELLLLHDESNAAEEHFTQGLDWARRQELLSWEMRSATSLVRLWHQRGRNSQARELLAPVYRRFTEGFGTADLKAAKELLDALR